MLTRDKIGRGPTEARVDADPDAMRMAQWLIRRLEGQGALTDLPSLAFIFVPILMMRRRLWAWRCGCKAPISTLQVSSLAQVDELAGAHPGGPVVLALLHQAELSLPEHVVEPATWWPHGGRCRRAEVRVPWAPRTVDMDRHLSA